MTREYRLRVDVRDLHRPDGALGVLLPVPPATPDQELRALSLDPRWSVEPLMAIHGRQRACFATFAEGAWTSAIVFDLADRGPAAEPDFAPSGAGVTDPGHDACAVALELALNNADSDGEKLRRIIDCVAAKFRYQSGYSNAQPLTCDVLTGNCLSINTAIMQLAQVANIRHAYHIGYFFETGRILTADDWHCWIATLTERGYECWDVAHQLKRRPGERIEPGLNPLPGTRFAMSVGYGLEFQLPFARVRVPHLCEPRWIFPDGTAQRCALAIRLEATGGGSRTLTDRATVTLEMEG